MIITEDFVLLNFPRTGSTFVRNVVKRLYGGKEGGVLTRLRSALSWSKPRLRELILPIDRTISALEQKRRSQHGSCAQIPARASGARTRRWAHEIPGCPFPVFRTSLSASSSR